MTELFLEYLKAQLGCIYVWGGQGETNITESWIRRRETSDSNAVRAIAFLKKQQAAGISPLAAYDCSGLIVKFLLDNRLTNRDMSSRGLYSACDRLNRDDLRPGDLVFRHNGEKIYHVGVYIGEGQAIEAKGRDDGVVQRDLDASGSGYWNRYGRLSMLTESKSDRMPESSVADENTPSDAQTPQSEFPAMHTYGGATFVYLREKPNTSAEVVGRVERGNRALVLSIQESWADAVVKNGEGYLRGWCSAANLKKI